MAFAVVGTNIRQWPFLRLLFSCCLVYVFRFAIFVFPAMATLARWNWVVEQLSSGRVATFHSSWNQLTAVSKLSFQLHDKNGADNSILLGLLRGVSFGGFHVSDKGHRHSSGTSAVVFFFRPSAGVVQEESSALAGIWEPLPDDSPRVAAITDVPAVRSQVVFADFVEIVEIPARVSPPRVVDESIYVKLPADLRAALDQYDDASCRAVLLYLQADRNDDDADFMARHLPADFFEAGICNLCDAFVTQMERDV